MDHYPPSTPLLENCPPGSDSMQRLVVHLDLFSGIGGFALAAKMAGGIKTAAFCEIDPYAKKVLAKNFPEIPIHGDIKTLDPNQYGTVELITGGFPCQPYSLAGNRKGKDDERALWPEMLRCIQEAKPRWILGENVVGLLSLGFQQIRADLEAIGYEVGCAIIPSHSKDAPHKRDRAWILCHLSDSESVSVEECTKESLPEIPNLQIQFRRVGEVVGIGSELCNTFELGVVDGVSAGMDRNRKARVMSLGNAIVPQVAAEILRCMMRVDSLHNKRMEGARAIVEELAAEIEEVKAEEEEALENLPDSLKEGERGQAMQSAIEALDEAWNESSEILDGFSTCIDQLSVAVEA